MAFLFSRTSRGKRPARSRRTRIRLEVERLEDRLVPSGYQQINLVGFQPGVAHFTDPNLNGWGMVGMPDGSFAVANPFNTGLATFYDRSGHVLPQTITVPASAAQPFGTAVGQPTGVVYNPTSDFVISANGKSAPARLIFDSIDGTISGWNPDVDPTHAIVMVDTFAAGHGVLFTGLDMAQNSQGQNVLYATEFSQKRVEMFDGGFTDIGGFTDPHATDLDANFGAWSVSALNDKLYVTFGDPFHVPSGGVVDVFDTDGHLLTPNHFAANAPGKGPLQNPWGIVQAPANFGAYSNDLLIGNVAGAGNINVFDPTTGAYLGQLRQPNGAPIAITGLWDLEFDSRTPNGGQTNQLFFDAGPNAPFVSGYGLFGVILPAGDQGGNGGGDPVLEVAALGHGSGALLGGVQAQLATSPSPAPVPAAFLAPQRLSTESALAVILAGGHDGGSFLSPYMAGVLAGAQTPATTQSLGGTAGQAHGFTVTATGLGADSYNVGADGAAFGVKNNTTLNVYELLKAVDRQAVFGVLYNGDKTLRNEANDLFNNLNQAGAIS
jgi:uncharacterized protein (TIGR03118 family)